MSSTGKRRTVFDDVPRQKSPNAMVNNDHGSSQTPKVPKVRDEYDFVCSSDEDEKVVHDPQDVPEQDILKGVVAYCEVRSKAEDRSESIAKQMELLGAKVSRTFTKDVTHVIFKDGKKSTKEKAQKKNVHLVSVLWIEGCKKGGKLVPENMFPVSDKGSACLRIAKFMQPGRSVEEDLKRSAERLKRRKRRLEKLQGRTPEATSTTPVTREQVFTPTSSRFAICPTPSSVPRLPEDFSEPKCDPISRIVEEDDSEESHIEKIAKRLRFNDNDLSEWLSKLASLRTDDEEDEEERLAVQNDKKKLKRKLISMKENLVQLSELSDPLQSQTDEAEEKTTGVQVKEKRCSTGAPNKNKPNQLRNSLEDFQETRKIFKSAKKPVNLIEHDTGHPNRKRKRKSQGLVMTSVHVSEQEIVFSVVKKLGIFFVQNKVSNETSHVIAGKTKRTMNVLKGISHGCWLLSVEWAIKSLEAGYWVDEEPYELSIDFPAAQLCRLERTTKGDVYRSSLLADVPAIYVGEGTSPPSNDLVELILLSGGNISTSYRSAPVCIGKAPKKIEATHISEQWLLVDSKRGKYNWDETEVNASLNFRWTDKTERKF